MHYIITISNPIQTDLYFAAGYGWSRFRCHASKYYTRDGAQYVINTHLAQIAANYYCPEARAERVLWEDAYPLLVTGLHSQSPQIPLPLD